jgi:quercetin dioxygenase-like cupin family protein
MDPQASGPIFIPPSAGTVLDALAVTHRLTSRQTDGSLYLFESTFEPGDGNRLHRHSREDEISYVLEGALEVRLADGRHVLEVGGVARLPKGIPHALRNPSTAPSRYLFIAVPGGLDRWFDEIARAIHDGTLDDATSDALSREYGLEWLE